MYTTKKANRKKWSQRNTKRVLSHLFKKKKKKVCMTLLDTNFESTVNDKIKAGIVLPAPDVESELVKIFSKLYANKKLDPRDDYYMYINFKWIATIKNTYGYLVQLDNFRITQDKVYYELLAIATNYFKTHKTPLATSIKNMYDSWLNLDESAIKNHIKTTVLEIDNYRANDDNLWAFLANISKNEIIKFASPLCWSLSADEKHSSHYSNYVQAAQVSLYDTDVYYETSPDFIKAKNKYLKYIKTIFSTCLGDDHTLNPTDVFDIERSILDAYDCGRVKDDPDEWYNKITAEEALPKYGFDWTTFATALGYKDVPKFFITENLNYILCMVELLKKEWTSQKWRSYWIYIYLRQMIRFHKEWQYIYFKFNGKYLTGQEKIMPRDLYPIFGIVGAFNTFLTNKYIDLYANTAYIDYTYTMANDLRLIFIRVIERNKWLSPSTKKAALLKLQNMKLNVGSPRMLREDPVLEYNSKDPWHNMQLYCKWRMNEFLQLNNKPLVDIPEMDWKQFKIIGTQAYIVNAYYTPTYNSVYIPIAYLQKPFVDLDERGIQYNLAYLGSTIAHEYSHALDDLGSRYDYKGNLHNWWTPHDKKIFNQKVEEVVRQYEQFYAYDGIKIDARSLVGESMADISGLALCQEYLTDWHQKNKLPMPLQFTSYKLFYSFYAEEMRSKIDKSAFYAQIKINPHPIDKYRTNCPLSRLGIFKSIYDIEPKDHMYWPTNDTIW